MSSTLMQTGTDENSERGVRLSSAERKGRLNKVGQVLVSNCARWAVSEGVRSGKWGCCFSCSPFFSLGLSKDVALSPRQNLIQCFGSLFDTDPDPAFQAEYRSKSRVFMRKH